MEYITLCLDSSNEVEQWYVRHNYRVIHKSIRKFRTRLRNNQERQGRKEHINR